MPQNETGRTSHSIVGPFTGRTLRIAQDGEPKRLSETAESKEEKPSSPGTVPPASMLFWNSLLVVGILLVFAFSARKSIQKKPKGFSNFAEFIAEQMSNFTTGIIGPDGAKYTPLIGTIFLYILAMNLIGLIPTLHSPTSNITFTLALGMFVFFYVQYVGVRGNGVVGHVKHFMGPIWFVAPLMFPVELISEISRPFTLAIRLFGNIFGEDVILLVLAGLGGASVATSWIPFHVPIMLLSVLTALVQAIVFATLTCIYISLVSHHDEEHEHQGGDHHVDLAHAGVPHHS